MLSKSKRILVFKIKKDNRKIHSDVIRTDKKTISAKGFFFSSEFSAKTDLRPY